MPVPKRKQSKTRKRKRRTHDSLSPLNLVPCPHCHKAVLPHIVCKYCGYYKGRPVVPVVEKAEKER